jgi:hypothetical protein
MKNCFECGSDYGVEDHHIIPRSLGGTKTIPLCGLCHMKAHGIKSKRRNNLSSLIKNGLQKRKEKGLNVGRPVGSTKDILMSPKNKAIAELLLSSKTMREISDLVKTSTTQVMRVKKLMNK